MGGDPYPVLEDVLDRKVSIDAARWDYGAAITSGPLAINLKNYSDRSA